MAVESPHHLRAPQSVDSFNVKVKLTFLQRLSHSLFLYLFCCFIIYVFTKGFILSCSTLRFLQCKLQYKYNVLILLLLCYVFCYSIIVSCSI